VLGNDGNVGGNDGLGAVFHELEALLLARRVLQKDVAVGFHTITLTCRILDLHLAFKQRKLCCVNCKLLLGGLIILAIPVSRMKQHSIFYTS